MTDSNDTEVKHLRELMETKSQALQLALELQAREYERRLNQLNHAHDRAVDAANKAVSRDIYDSDKKTDSEKYDNMLRDIETIRREISVDLARRTGRVEMVAIIAMIISLISPLLIRVFFP